MGHRIEHWNPEDEQFWRSEGRLVARRNLVWSIVAEHIGFSVWMIWSAVAPLLPKAGFHYTPGQLFTLVAVPGLVGALLRFPYTLGVAWLGGRTWTVLSALVLLIPSALLAYAGSHPETPFGLMLLFAATAGFGGGNFASSMANISYFYPDKHKGLALGINAAGGNIGVSTVQLIVPAAVAVGAASMGGPQIAHAGVIWLVPIAIAATGAFFFMNDLANARSNVAAQIRTARSRHTWFMSILYLGTFGSFVGYSAAFPLLLKLEFPHSKTSIAFLLPLVGSAARPLGGWIADRLGGARVSSWSFACLGLATISVLHFVRVQEYAGFVAAFLAILIAAGIGNGSTFRMIPTIFRAEHLRRARHAAVSRTEALARARWETAAALGFTSAIGAIGSFFIPKGFGASIAATGTPATALLAFAVFYLLCWIVTVTVYRDADATAEERELPDAGSVAPDVT